MITRPLNPDRIKEVIALMNKYAVNGVVDGNNPDYQAEIKAINEKYENMEAQGGDSQLPPPFLPGEQGVEGVNNLPPNDNQQLPPFLPGEQGVEGVNNLPPNDEGVLKNFENLYDSQGSDELGSANLINPISHTVLPQEEPEGDSSLASDQLVEENITPTEDSEPVQIYSAFAQNDPLLENSDKFNTLGAILHQSLAQMGVNKRRGLDSRDDVTELNPQRHQMKSAIFQNDAGDTLEYNFVGKRAGEFSYDKRPSSLEGYKLVSGTFRNNDEDKDTMFFDVPEEFQNYDYTNALKFSPTLAAEQYAKITKDDKSDNDIYYIDPDGNRQVDITGTGQGIPVGSTHIGRWNAHSDSVNNAGNETFTPSEGANFYQAAFTKGTDGFYVTGSDQDPFKDSMVGSFNYDETTGTAAQGVDSDFLNEYKFGKDGPTSSFMDTITDEEGNLQFGSESSFDLGAAFGLAPGNFVLSSFPSDRINLEGFMEARGNAGSDAQFLYNQMDKSANFAELFGKGEGLELPENFFTDTNIMQDTMNQYLQGDDTKKGDNNINFHDSFNQITKSDGYGSGDPFEDNGGSSSSGDSGDDNGDDANGGGDKEVPGGGGSPFIPFSGFVAGEDKRDIEVLPSTPRTFEPDPRLDPIFPAYAQPETTSVTTPNVSQGASLAEIMASPDPTVSPGMNPYFSGITTANQPVKPTPQPTPTPLPVLPNPIPDPKVYPIVDPILPNPIPNPIPDPTPTPTPQPTDYSYLSGYNTLKEGGGAPDLALQTYDRTGTVIPGYHGLISEYSGRPIGELETFKVPNQGTNVANITTAARGGGIYSLNNRMLQGMASPSMYKGIMS